MLNKSDGKKIKGLRHYLLKSIPIARYAKARSSNARHPIAEAYAGISESTEAYSLIAKTCEW